MFNANSKYTSICCGFEEHDIGLFRITIDCIQMMNDAVWRHPLELPL